MITSRNSEIKSLTFFFPYQHVSGVSILFANLASYLAENTELVIYIVDYQDGAMARSLKKGLNIGHIIFKDFQSCKINYKTTLVMQAGFFSKIRQELKIGNNVKILFWAAHEHNLVPYLSSFRIINILLLRFSLLYKLITLLDRKVYLAHSKCVEKMIIEKNIFFMTKIIFETTRNHLKLNKLLKPYYLQNFSMNSQVYDIENTLKKVMNINNKVAITWVGRIVNFKYFILMHTLKKLDQIANKENWSMDFHIIGGGSFENKILDINNDYFKIIRHGVLPKTDVDIFLKKKTQLLFAMGTAALDGAALGIPVVLLDQTLKKIKKDYQFRYLHDTEDYDLGHPISHSDFKKGNDSLRNILKDLYQNYLVISKKSFQYYNNHHSVEKAAKKFLAVSKHGGFNYEDVPRLCKKNNIFRKLYTLYLQKIKKTYY